jgi:fatty-acyl-CoA synthase
VNVIDQVVQKLWVARTLAAARVIRPTRPDKLVGLLRALRRWGPTPAAGATTGAIRSPDATAIIDERGTLTFRDVHLRTNAITHELCADGLGPGRTLAILCRNHRGFLEATIAASKAGADVLYLNTAFAAPQLADVLARERPHALVHDAEFSPMVAEAAPGLRRYVAWADPSDDVGADRLDDLAARGRRTDLEPPARPGKVVILTSGTTGAPKGANRKQPDTIEPTAALFDRIPLRAQETTMIAAPLFHTWGYAHMMFAFILGSTILLRRRFEPEPVLADLARHRATAFVVVPVMLQRILDLGEDVIRRYDTSALRVIAASGSALPGELATRVMDVFGDVLYNLYGSTEVAWASIATPADLRAAPGTAGRPPRGTVLKILDEHGRELPQGQSGRIFVGNELQFEGYSGGGHKEFVDGLMSSGDIGHFDEVGRLFIDGRDDEMIVSGGENVFPREVEDLLAKHDAIAEAAVIGVDDAEFGQRLKAFVVTRDSARLTADDVKAYVRDNLARYKVPRDVVFLDELPRNATGKVLKKDLA